MTENQTANSPSNTYEIAPHPDGSGFDVRVGGFDGARQTLMNFKTEAEAQEWIAGDSARDRSEGKPG